MSTLSGFFPVVLYSPSTVCLSLHPVANVWLHQSSIPKCIGTVRWAWNSRTAVTAARAIHLLRTACQEPQNCPAEKSPRSLPAHVGSEPPRHLLYLRLAAIPSSEAREKGFPRKPRTKETKFSGCPYLAAEPRFAQRLLSRAWQGEVWH